MAGHVGFGTGLAVRLAADIAAIAACFAWLAGLDARFGLCGFAVRLAPDVAAFAACFACSAWLAGFAGLASSTCMAGHAGVANSICVDGSTGFGGSWGFAVCLAADAAAFAACFAWLAKFAGFAGLTDPTGFAGFVGAAGAAGFAGLAQLRVAASADTNPYTHCQWTGPVILNLITRSPTAYIAHQPGHQRLLYGQSAFAALQSAHACSPLCA